MFSICACASCRLQEEVIQKCSYGDIKVTLLQMEVERIMFVVASYLRTRVQKVRRPSKLHDTTVYCFCWHTGSCVSIWSYDLGYTAVSIPPYDALLCSTSGCGVQIEQFPLYVLEQQGKLDHEKDEPLLSPEEVTYAKQ